VEKLGTRFFNLDFSQWLHILNYIFFRIFLIILQFYILFLLDAFFYSWAINNVTNTCGIRSLVPIKVSSLSCVKEKNSRCMSFIPFYMVYFVQLGLFGVQYDVIIYQESRQNNMPWIKLIEIVFLKKWNKTSWIAILGKYVTVGKSPTPKNENHNTSHIND